MIKNIIKYVGIALVLIGIILVMKNLFSKDTEWTSNKKDTNKSTTYTVNIKLIDKQTNNYVEGAKLIVKDSNDELVAEWTTTNKEYKINNMKKGTYALVQVSAADNYHLNEDKITFTITKNNQSIIMYNTKMTEEEIKAANTTNTEVGVDNTASSKSIFTTIIAIITTTIGLNMIYKVKKSY